MKKLQAGRHLGSEFAFFQRKSCWFMLYWLNRLTHSSSCWPQMKHALFVSIISKQICFRDADASIQLNMARLLKPYLQMWLWYIQTFSKISSGSSGLSNIKILTLKQPATMSYWSSFLPVSCVITGLQIPMEGGETWVFPSHFQYNLSGSRRLFLILT